MDFCLKFLFVVGEEVDADVRVRKSVQVHRGKVLMMRKIMRMRRRRRMMRMMMIIRARSLTAVSSCLPNTREIYMSQKILTR